MDNGMSLSDIAAVTRGASDENGWGSGWFLIVVLFLFMFGFGGNGWNRQGEFGQFVPVQLRKGDAEIVSYFLPRTRMRDYRPITPVLYR